MSNLTSVLDENSELFYSHLYGTAEEKVILYVTLFHTSVIGPILCFGIVLFEMFGGDSQKRTIVNMILSATLCNLGIVGVIMGILRGMRDIFGLLEFQDFVAGVLILQGFFKVSLFIFYTLLTITRYLFIVVWKRMRGVEDKFWGAFLTSATYLMSLLMVCFTICGGFTPQTVHFIKLYKEFKQNDTTIWR